MTPEKKVKQAVAKILDESGAYWFYASTHGYGSSGVPDIVGTWWGAFFAIECKAGNNKPTALQHKNIMDIRRAGGLALVINEDCLKWLSVVFPPRHRGRPKPQKGGGRRVKL